MAGGHLYASDFHNAADILSMRAYVQHDLLRRLGVPRWPPDKPWQVRSRRSSGDVVEGTDPVHRLERIRVRGSRLGHKLLGPFQPPLEATLSKDRAVKCVLLSKDRTEAGGERARRNGGIKLSKGMVRICPGLAPLRPRLGRLPMKRSEHPRCSRRFAYPLAKSPAGQKRPLLSASPGCHFVESDGSKFALLLVLVDIFTSIHCLWSLIVNLRR